MKTEISETTELACLLGYIANLTAIAVEKFVAEDVSAEAAFDHAVDEWKQSHALSDSKEE